MKQTLTYAIIGAVLLYCGSSPVLAATDDAKSAAYDLVNGYFAAVEKEDLAAIEKIFHFKSTENRQRILAQFRFAFDMADTQLESVDIENISMTPAEGVGLVIAKVNAKLSAPDGDDIQQKEKRFAIILLLKENEWKIARIMRKGDYDAGIRLTAYNATPEYLQKPQATVKTSPKAKSAAKQARGNIFIADIKQKGEDLLVNLSGEGLKPGMVIQGELQQAQINSVVERSMVVVIHKGAAPLQFRTPFMGWSPGMYTVNIRVSNELIATRSVEIKD